MKEFNINSYVYVRLTDMGKGILKDLYPTLTHLYAENELGWSKWQLHELMNVFGNHVHNGCIPPFELKIRIADKDLKEV
jgi:hypothetical protein